MAKSRVRIKAKNKRKIYTHQRPRKEGRAPEKPSLIMSQYRGCIEHSKEIAMLKIEKKHLIQLIAMCARNRDIMDHFIQIYKEQVIWFNNKINEHMKAASVKMILFLGEHAENYNIPEDFHLGSTDLKNGYVTIENKKEQLHTIIMANAPAKFPNDLIKIGTILENNDTKIEKLNIESLLKNEDVISTILSSKVSILEDKLIPNKDKWHCSSVSCLERKPKINFEDL